MSVIPASSITGAAVAVRVSFSELEAKKVVSHWLRLSNSRLHWENALFTLIWQFAQTCLFSFDPSLTEGWTQPRFYQISEPYRSQAMMGESDRHHHGYNLLCHPIIMDIGVYYLHIRLDCIVDDYHLVGFTDQPDKGLGSGCALKIWLNGRQNSIDVNGKLKIWANPLGELQNGDIIECQLNLRLYQCTFKCRRNQMAYRVDWHPTLPVYAGVRAYRSDATFTIVD